MIGSKSSHFSNEEQFDNILDRLAMFDVLFYNVVFPQDRQ